MHGAGRPKSLDGRLLKLSVTQLSMQLVYASPMSANGKVRKDLMSPARWYLEQWDSEQQKLSETGAVPAVEARIPYDRGIKHEMMEAKAKDRPRQYRQLRQVLAAPRNGRLEAEAESEDEAVPAAETKSLVLSASSKDRYLKTDLRINELFGLAFVQEWKRRRGRG